MLKTETVIGEVIGMGSDHVILRLPQAQAKEILAGKTNYLIVAEPEYEKLKQAAPKEWVSIAESTPPERSTGIWSESEIVLMVINPPYTKPFITMGQFFKGRATAYGGHAQFSESVSHWAFVPKLP